MRKLIRCGRLFTGNETNALSDQTLVIEDDKVVFAGAAAKAPEAAPHDEVIDHSRHFVMPGLIDSHVHLSYGNAKTQEDIDLYASLEFRAIRGLEAAQRVLRGLYSDGRSEYQRPRQPRGARRDRGGIVRRPARQQLRARAHHAPGAG
jgi:predicted amidohydrolase YtcJ